MAEIVLGMWTTHGPTLSTTPEQWLLRLPADHARKNHPFRGNNYDFDSLLKLRGIENLTVQCTAEARQRHSKSCQAAIHRMADIYAAAAADVAVIFGNDQNEMFLEDIMPAFTVFHGDKIWNQPASEAQAKNMAPGIHEAEAGHNPPMFTEYPGCPELGTYLIEAAMAANFDVARSTRLPENPGHWNSGIGHAFGFIYRQIMCDQVPPNVPLIANTFFPPNQPTARRCFEFGRAIGKAIRAWPRQQKVAIFGSGGMSHFVIDEAFDKMIIDAISNRDGEALCNISETELQSGTSELKNWIAAAGALFETNLSGGLIDYQPCYRSAAGTGTANGFMAWR